MVAMIESQCEYFMYFPAVPILDLSDAAKFKSVPQRRHLYLGETVQFLLVLRVRDGGSETPTKAGGWRELVRSLSAVASVSLGEAQQPSEHESSQFQQDFQSSCSEDGEDEECEMEAATPPCRVEERTKVFRQCKPLLTHNVGRHNRTEEFLVLLSTLVSLLFYRSDFMIS